MLIKYLVCVCVSMILRLYFQCRSVYCFCCCCCLNISHNIHKIYELDAHVQISVHSHTHTHTWAINRYYYCVDWLIDRCWLPMRWWWWCCYMPFFTYAIHMCCMHDRNCIQLILQHIHNAYNNIVIMNANT